MSGNVTKITATNPQILSKLFGLDANGELYSETSGFLIDGTLETLFLGSLEDLRALLLTLNPSQALTYGVPNDEAASRVVTQKAYEAMGCPAGVVCRTNDMFPWPSGPGIMMLDYDPQEGLPPMYREVLIEAIRKAAPELRSEPMLWYPSASSCIFLGDRELRGIMGQRLYLLVEDATDIPRAGKALAERLWRAGYGYIKVSASGQMLERCLIDTSVWQPSRLDFAGGAACFDGLEQRRGEPVIFKGY